MKAYEKYTGGSNGNGGTHRAPREIEHDLAEIRAEINQTVQAIEEKISPGELLDQAIHQLGPIGRGSSEFFQNLGRQVRDNPVPTVMIGAGLALLAWSRRGEGSEYGGRYQGLHLDSDDRDEEQGQGRLEGAKESIKEKLAGAKEMAREKLGEARDKMSSMREGAGDASHEAGDKVRAAGERAREGARRIQGRATEAWHEQPLVVGALGLALGAAIGAALPRSRIEDQSIGRLRDEGKHRAERIAGQVAERGKEVVSEAKETIDQRMEHIETPAGPAVGSPPPTVKS